MKTLLFIRHGATAGNLEKRYIGRTDEPLCPLGIQQINTLRKQQLSADLLFVSPMLRTRQTAELLFPQNAMNLVEDFRETDFGIFEGKTADELSDSAEYQNWLDSFCLAPVPRGESILDFKDRCCSAFAEIIDKIPDNTSAAFVVHGGVIMAILERFAQPHRNFYDYHIQNGQVLFCHLDTDSLRLINPDADSQLC